MRYFVLSILVSLLAVPQPIAAAIVLADDFNRTDGAVGNGWNTWGNVPNIVGNELETYGGNGVAGGIWMNKAVTLPVTFSFSFRTTSPSDGAWQIGFNSPTANNVAEAQVLFYQACCGSSFVNRVWMTAGGQQSDSGTTTGTLEDFETADFARIEGILYPDLSASISIWYASGNSATTVFTAPGDGIGPQGSILYLGNSNASFGPHYFDDFSLAEVPEPSTLGYLVVAGALMGFLRLNSSTKS